MAERAAQRSGRLGIGIIGAGRVGPVLGAALAGAGHAVVGISAVSEASRDRAAYAEAIATATSCSAAIGGQSMGILQKLGIEQPGRLIAPLVRSSVENALGVQVADAIDLSELEE